MAKEEKEKPKGKGGEAGKGEGAKGKAKKLHLHEIRTVQAKDGSLVHHHTYKDSADAPHTHPERGPMATSQTPADAGQHVEEQFAMNQGAPQAGGAEPGGGEGEPEEGAEPEAGAMPGE